MTRTFRRADASPNRRADATCSGKVTLRLLGGSAVRRLDSEANRRHGVSALTNLRDAEKFFLKKNRRAETFARVPTEIPRKDVETARLLARKADPATKLAHKRYVRRKIGKSKNLQKDLLQISKNLLSRVHANIL